MNAPAKRSLNDSIVKMVSLCEGDEPIVCPTYDATHPQGERVLMDGTRELLK